MCNPIENLTYEVSCIQIGDGESDTTGILESDEQYATM